jgi:hypothetical protein
MVIKAKIKIFLNSVDMDHMIIKALQLVKASTGTVMMMMIK